MPLHHSINYLEIPSENLSASKAFFETVFHWQFTDYGDEYTAFHNDSIAGGFYRSSTASRTKSGAALIVFFSKNLEQSLADVTQARGQISQDIFAFPGGRRFHFIEPGGSEFAVWSEV